MSDGEAQPQPGGAAGRDKREWTEEVMGELIRLMGVRAKVEVKDIEATEQIPASVSVAVTPEEEVPGLQAGKRSPVADALQFLANKIINRGADKRWINVGIGGHPEPRTPGQKKQKQPAQQQAQAQQQQQSAAPAPGQSVPSAKPSPAPAPPQKKGKKEKKEPRAASSARADESKLEVADDPELTRLGTLLAEKAQSFGRVYAVLPATPAERVLLARGAEGVADVTVKMDGEGRHRRVVFTPANPKPMPKKSYLPDYDEEEEGEDED